MDGRTKIISTIFSKHEKVSEIDLDAEWTQMDLSMQRDDISQNETY